MAEPTDWRRGGGYNATANYYGWIKLIEFAPGETLLKTWWKANLWGTYQATSYPPGSALTKVGLLWASATEPSGGQDTPVSQPDSDWIAMATVSWDGLAWGSTTTFWWLHAETAPQDLEVKSMRKNDTGDLMALWVSWESFLASDTGSGWNYKGHCGVSCLVGNPSLGT
jgi:hypothetical protein